MNQNFKQLSSELENILSPKTKQREKEDKLILSHIIGTEVKDLWKAFEQVPSSPKKG